MPARTRRTDPAAGLTVREILGTASLELELLAGANGLDRAVTTPRVAKALSPPAKDGDGEGRLFVLGPAELETLQDRPARRFAAAVARGAAAYVIAAARPAPEGLRRAADRTGVALLRSRDPVRRCAARIRGLLEARLAPGTAIHGVLVEVFDVGVLIIGPSGIGKSESALELVIRGHRLIADDLIMVRPVSASGVVGRAPGESNHHMEIRGLGIINIKDLFGVAAVMDAKKLELVIELEEWRPDRDYDRLGLDEATYRILDRRIPYVRLPVSPGRNMAVILEVAARNHLLKRRGYFTAREFARSLHRRLGERAPRGN